MKKELSPEERLLRLIKRPKKKESSKENGIPKKIEVSEPMTRISGMPARGAKEENKQAKAISIPFKSVIRGINMRVFNSALIVVLICLLTYFIFDIFYTFYHTKEPGMLAGDERIHRTIGTESAHEVKPYNYYSSSIEGRNIFRPQQVEVESVIEGPTTEEVSANLSLIGVIKGDRPQAIIANKKSGKSYFLYTGGSVDKAKVVEILKDSVIMEYQGQKFELVL